MFPARLGTVISTSDKKLTTSRDELVLHTIWYDGKVTLHMRRSSSHLMICICKIRCLDLCMPACSSCLLSSPLTPRFGKSGAASHIVLVILLCISHKQHYTNTYSTAKLASPLTLINYFPSNRSLTSQRQARIPSAAPQTPPRVAVLAALVFCFPSFRFSRTVTAVLRRNP